MTVGLFGREKQIEVHVIDGSAPFLLSSKFMYENNIVVDFRDGMVAMNDEDGNEIRWVKLERAPSYHLMMSILDYPGRKQDNDDDKEGGDDGLEPTSTRTSTEGQQNE